MKEESFKKMMVVGNRLMKFRHRLEQYLIHKGHFTQDDADILLELAEIEIQLYKNWKDSDS